MRNLRCVAEAGPGGLPLGDDFSSATHRDQTPDGDVLAPWGQHPHYPRGAPTSSHSNKPAATSMTAPSAATGRGAVIPKLECGKYLPHSKNGPHPATAFQGASALRCAVSWLRASNGENQVVNPRQIRADSPAGFHHLAGRPGESPETGAIIGLTLRSAV